MKHSANTGIYVVALRMYVGACLRLRHLAIDLVALVLAFSWVFDRSISAIVQQETCFL